MSSITDREVELFSKRHELIDCSEPATGNSKPARYKRLTSDHRVAGSSAAGCMPEAEVLTQEIREPHKQRLDTSWTL
jgi:hypothetical protein